ncbi:MAG: hypothetical protein IKQ71_02555 [Lachnospiraceae bacterium]|nr:hypothetical protein [Lachnospiraceae bacterium]
MIIPILLIFAGVVLTALGAINYINALQGFRKAKSISYNADYNLVIDKARIVFSVLGGALVGFAFGALVLAIIYLLGSTFGNASTGTDISALHGFAKSRALFAFFGGGAKLSGGLGMSGGRLAMFFATFGPASFMSGKAAKKKAIKAMENADAQRAVSAKKVEESREQKEARIYDELKTMKNELKLSSPDE